MAWRGSSVRSRPGPPLFEVPVKRHHRCIWCGRSRVQSKMERATMQGNYKGSWQCSFFDSTACQRYIDKKNKGTSP
jgi:hypothetical protein